MEKYPNGSKRRWIVTRQNLVDLRDPPNIAEGASARLLDVRRGVYKSAGNGILKRVVFGSGEWYSRVRSMDRNETKGDDEVMGEVMTYVIKPTCSLVGLEENIYALLGAVSTALEKKDMFDEVDEFVQRAISLLTYDEVLRLSQDYVQFEHGGSNESQIE